MDSSATLLLEPNEPQHERRRAPRQTFITKGLLYREDRQAAPQRIMLKNLSVLGVGFEAAMPIEPGTRCRIRIEAGPTQINWRMQVVCCGKIDGGAYRIGGEFVRAELEKTIPVEPPAAKPVRAEPLMLVPAPRPEPQIEPEPQAPDGIVTHPRAFSETPSRVVL